jgi:alpha-1,2-mannosyltransferase
MTPLSFPRLLSGFRTRYAAHPQRFRAAFLGLLAIILLVTSLQYLAKVAKPAENGRQSRSAFLRWRAMILDVFEGANVYVGKNEYPNPPVMAIVLRPFAELPPVVGAMSWFYAKVLMAVLAALWTFRLVSPDPPARSPNPPTPFPGGEGGERESPSPPGGGVGEGFTNSLASQSSSSGCVGFSPSRPKSPGEPTIPRPK